MTTIFDFAAIAVLVFGSLQIILFFKLWIMANNIKKIKEENTIYPKNVSPALFELALGNIEKAIDLGRKEFLNNVYRNYLYALQYQGDKHREDIYNSEHKSLVERYESLFKGDILSIDYDRFSTLGKVKSILNL